MLESTYASFWSGAVKIYRGLGMEGIKDNVYCEVDRENG
jgi:hypothetical protein